MASEQIRKRRDSRRDSTRMALIEKAEALIAVHGVDGVSPRQIGAAIGSANNNVVAYHFGGMKELVDAIYYYRLPSIEARRAELLAGLVDHGLAEDVRQLVDALWRPLFEQVNEEGRHSYAAFLAGVTRSGWTWTRYSLGEEFHREVGAIVLRISPLLHESARPLLGQRLPITSAMMTHSLAALDGELEDQEAVFRDLVKMVAAALQVV